jgi:hypothetical protein
MGLDMYLEKHTYVQRWDHIPPEKQFSVTVTRGGKPFTDIKPERVCYVIEQVAYWRKANAIHGWFVQNVQGGVDNCEPHFVGRDKLRELLAAVNAALDAFDQRTNPDEILPTQSGFFFGNTVYDDFYREDLQDTRRQLEPLLAEDGGEDGIMSNASYYYRSSW